MPPPEETLEEAIGRLMQRLEGQVRVTGRPAAPVRFPRGVIGTASDFRRRLPFLRESHTKRNIAYAWQFADVNHWLMSRWDLGLSAADMLRKQAAIWLVTIMEAICREMLQELYLRSRDLYPHSSLRAPGSDTFKTVIDRLARLELVSPELHRRLHALRELRNRVHIHLVDHSERGEYSAAHYQEAQAVLEELRTQLSAHFPDTAAFVRFLSTHGEPGNGSPRPSAPAGSDRSRQHRQGIRGQDRSPGAERGRARRRGTTERT